MLTSSIRALALGLIASGILGCTTVRTVVEPVQCTAPLMPYLPTVESSSLTLIDDATYWALMEREKRLADWALEMESMLIEVCDER